MTTRDGAAYFDGWYTDMRTAPVKDEIEQRHLKLPPQLLSTSLLTWDGVAEVTSALRLSPGDLLLDLACGRGGYGLEIVSRTGARLLGLDFSPVAVRQARGQAAHLQREAEFAVGRLEATGLATACVDAAIVVDAVQFADPAEAAYGELARVVRPHGRVALTCGEARDHADPTVAVRLRSLDLRQGLTDAGFTDICVVERETWRTRARDVDGGGGPRPRRRPGTTVVPRRGSALPRPPRRVAPRSGHRNRPRAASLSTRPGAATPRAAPLVRGRLRLRGRRRPGLGVPVSCHPGRAGRRRPCGRSP